MRKSVFSNFSNRLRRSRCLKSSRHVCSLSSKNRLGLPTRNPIHYDISNFPQGILEVTNSEKVVLKIAVDLGHNCRGDRGAVGIKNEDDLIFDVGRKLTKLLRQEGHETIVTTPRFAKNVTDSLHQRCLMANQNKCDLFVSIHFNAFNKMAYGSEVYAVSTRAQQVGARILTEICKLGFFNRGVKNRNFYVLKWTKMPAILVECCFCDSSRDMRLYDPVTMAIAIKNGIVGKTGVYNPQPKKQYLKVKQTTWVKKTTEQAAVLTEADKVPLKPGFYTIELREPTEESHFWIQLKSGLSGFVFQDHAEVVVR